MDVSHRVITRCRKRRTDRPRTEEQLHTGGRGSPQGPARRSSKACMDRFGVFFLFEEFCEGTTSIHLLEKAGDVVFAAGRPGEGVGVGCDVGGHQFGRLVAFGTAGIPDPVVVHPKTERHKIEASLRRGSKSFLYHPRFAARISILQEAELRAGLRPIPMNSAKAWLPSHFRGDFQLAFKKGVVSQREMGF